MQRFLRDSNDVTRHVGINGETQKNEFGFEALFLGEECTDNFAPDHGEEKVFLDYADFRE